MSQNLINAKRHTSNRIGTRLSRICLTLGVLFLGSSALRAADWDYYDRPSSSHDHISRYAPDHDYTSPINSSPRFDDSSSRRFQLNRRSRDPDRLQRHRDVLPSTYESPSRYELPPRYDLPSHYDNNPTLPQYDRQPTAPVEETESEKIQSRLTSRYSNPVVVRFVNSLTAERGLALYSETARLIDSRHLEPTAYQERVRRGALNLMYAVENPAFVQAVRLSASPQSISAYRNSLGQLVQSRTVNNSNDALNVLRSAMDLSSQSLRIPPAAVAMEFVSGATETLDKYSAFVPEENQRQPSADLDDHVVGIGVEIKLDDRGVLILKTLRGGPAAQAGLKADDLIVSANGQSLAGKSLDFIVDQIGGAEGTSLTLGVVRDGGRETQVRLVRRRVTIYSVSEVQMLGGDSKVGYIKLDKFAQSSDEEMDQALWSLHQQGMQSLVIDLRGNPGGLLTTAISLSNKFLPSGSIVSTRGRNPSDNTSESATYERTWSVPLVVVIDENSASASEIFAAAIQENDRGVIVGRKSYGKGSVQTHFPLQSVSGNLKLTTARFYSPTGRVMAGSGVTPDMPVSVGGVALERYTASDTDIRQALRVASSPELKDLANAGYRNSRQRESHLDG